MCPCSTSRSQAPWLPAPSSSPWPTSPSPAPCPSSFSAPSLASSSPPAGAPGNMRRACMPMRSLCAASRPRVVPSTQEPDDGGRAALAVELLGAHHHRRARGMTSGAKGAQHGSGACSYVDSRPDPLLATLFERSSTQLPAHAATPADHPSTIAVQGTPGLIR